MGESLQWLSGGFAVHSLSPPLFFVNMSDAFQGNVGAAFAHAPNLRARLVFFYYRVIVMAEISPFGPEYINDWKENAMSSVRKCNSIEDLLNMWKGNPKYGISAFVKDGIVSPREYETPHILYVLRDMNCGDEERDLRAELARHGSGWKTWNNAARWTIALLDNQEEYPERITTEMRAAQLRRVAAMNIKKQGGTSRVDWPALVEAAKTQNDEIMREIELCDPSIIICCGSGNADVLKEHVFRETATDWCDDLRSQTFEKTWHYYYTNINNKKVPVVSFCHPQVTNLCGKRGHADLLEPLYRDVLQFRKFFNF